MQRVLTPKLWLRTPEERAFIEAALLMQKQMAPASLCFAVAVEVVVVD